MFDYRETTFSRLTLKTLSKAIVQKFNCHLRRVNGSKQLLLDLETDDYYYYQNKPRKS